MVLTFMLNSARQGLTVEGAGVVGLLDPLGQAASPAAARAVDYL